MPHQGQTGVTFDSGGHRLLGTLFLARGDQPKPTAVIHPQANHSFTWHRPWLRDQLLGWLESLNQLIAVVDSGSA